MSTNTAEAKLNETGSRRQALHFWIDTATALAFAGLFGTAAIMKWILPPGSCDVPGTIEVWLGYPRHWWGGVHFWIAVGLFVLIIFHTYLHWTWVLTVWRKLVGGFKSPGSWALGAFMVGLLAVPWLIPSANVAVSTATADPCATCPEAEICGAAGNGSAGVDCAVAGVATKDPCATCPEAGKCGGESCAEKQPAEDAAKADPCASCPKAGNCSEQAQQGS